MPPPFIPLNVSEFAKLLEEWQSKREIESVHMHHTWRPNRAEYQGHESIVAMYKLHTERNGWSDIAQHVTIAPDGTVWTGRHWDQPPASVGGRNGTSKSGPFMLEVVGNFDRGKDTFDGVQK